MTAILVRVAAGPDVRVESLCGMLSSPVDTASRSRLYGQRWVTQRHILKCAITDYSIALSTGQRTVDPSPHTSGAAIGGYTTSRGLCAISY